MSERASVKENPYLPNLCLSAASFCPAPFLGDYGSLPLSVPSLPPSLRHSTTSHFTRKDRKCCKEQRTSRPPLRSTQFPICRVPLSSSNKSSVLPPKSQSCGSSLSYCRRRILVVGTWDMTKESSWPAHICRLQGVKMRCSSG